jgi:streptogramin lyase
MPAPKDLGGGILSPNLKPGHESFAQISVGQDGEGGPALPAASEVSGLAPEQQIREAVAAVTDVASANAAGDAARPLVAQMRSRDRLPRPSDAVGGAVDVQFANAEAYVSDRALRVAPGGAVRFSVTNLDNVARTFAVRQLFNRSTVSAPGVLGWGAFDTNEVARVTLAPGETKRDVTVTPAGDAFSLWVGDPAGGDQAAAAVALDRGPRQQSLELGLGPIKPLHQAFDKTGKLWVTFANSDQVARLSPTSDSLSSPAPEVITLPGGRPGPPADGTAAVGGVLGPGDVQVDHAGIVWVALGAANAIARIDPSVAHAGSTAGIAVHHLQACTATTCRTAPAVGQAAPLTRLPLQLRVRKGADGNTEVFFTEQNADAIGMLRFTPSGTRAPNGGPGEQHFNCGCVQPLGIALDPNGDIWFSEGSTNALGRMTLDAETPFAANAHTVKHYKIPNPVEEFVPGQARNNCGRPGLPACPVGTLPNPAITALPHSVALDHHGRVWYTGEANERVGYLDPAQAVANTTQGFHDTAGPVNEFGRALAPADLAIDKTDTVFFTDEYGDQIASATASCDSNVHAKFAFRPTARNSLTDSPVVDAQGNLWFLEAGANLITRISGVANRGAAPDCPAAPAGGGGGAGAEPGAPAVAVPGVGQAPGQTGAKATGPAPCVTGRWLTRTGKGRKARRTVPLLGLAASDVRRCLGAPAKRTQGAGGDRWTYRGRKALELRFTNGRVSAFTLRGAAIASAPDRAAVGAKVAAFRTALGAVTRVRGGYRGIVALGSSTFADVRLAVSRSKVTRVTVTLKPMKALDSAGRRLLRSIR